jgi:hypothetical protein
MADKKKLTLDDSGEIIAEVTKSEPKDLPKREPKEYVFQLVGQFPMHFHMSNEGIIYCEETQKERSIRYLEGVNTIFVDEQKDIPAARLTQGRPKILFEAGTLRVPAIKKTFIEFMTKNEMNDGVTNRLSERPPVYTVINNDKRDEDKIKLQEDRMAAMELAFKADTSELIPHAKYLGVAFENEYGLEKALNSIRMDYVDKADKDPSQFLKTYNNPIVKAKYYVDLAINRGLLTTGLIKGQAHWGATKGLITSLPIEQDPSEYLANYCFKDEGKAFYERLKELVG